NGGAEFCAARIPRAHNLEPAGCEIACEQLGLGRLARAVASLEADEDARHGYSPCAPVALAAARAAAFALRVSAAFFAAAERAGSTAFALAFALAFVPALPAVFFAVVFFAAPRAPRFGAGPFARLIASSSTARSNVISSGFSPRGIVAFVSPSVT